MTWSKHFVW